ncbi:MAG TPA: hypothetical protein PL190_07205 [Caldisericia bacterium]|nr:MAG: hypothetical protein BWX90_01484 [bacterium ADurb.Bin132]HNY61821.1 hypothetical protein [Caldisericia bacterium]HOC79652.1 hypothetical protein [Caldisericia bacterium]HOG70943.1 hypothetical protein [Caldisericia bacterium]HPA66294.1 hypothetical protein [Caldisericia bacterium]
MKIRVSAICAVLVLSILVSPAGTMSISTPKGEKFLIADATEMEFSPAINGNNVVWFQKLETNWGYRVMHKDLNTGIITQISRNDEYLPYIEMGHDLYITNKYCYWLAANYDTHTVIVVVYDFNQKRDIIYDYSQEKKYLSWPTVHDEYLFFWRYDSRARKFELMMDKLNTPQNPKVVFVSPYAGVSPIFANEGYATWTDSTDVYLYDINHEKVTKITDTPDSEYYAMIQNGIVWYSLYETYPEIRHTLYGYRIKEGTYFKVHERTGQYWQYLAFNPDSRLTVFLEYYYEGQYEYSSIWVYDQKKGTLKEIAKDRSYNMRWGHGCSSKDVVVWMQRNASGKGDLKLYDYNKDTTYTLTDSSIFYSCVPKIDNKTIVWIEIAYNGGNWTKQICGFTLKGE